MTGYSITQQANLASLIACVGIIMRIVSDPSSISAEEWQLVGMSVVTFVASAISYVNRHMKGDVTGLGKYK